MQINIINYVNDHIEYFDNFFTNHNLLVCLKENELKQNRMKECTVMISKDVKSKLKEEYDYHYDKESDILYVKLDDNSVVTLGTDYSFKENK